jgi:acyl-CoA hydrolase
MEARAHNVYTGNQAIVLKTHIKFVHIDEEGHPIPLGEKARNRVNNILTEKSKEELGK